MKFFLPLILFAALCVSAQDPNCPANFIIDKCLFTERAKLSTCGLADYDCQCAAYDSIASCYANCPFDNRASAAKNQVLIYCGQASAHGTAAAAKHQKTDASPLGPSLDPTMGVLSPSTAEADPGPTGSSSRIAPLATPAPGSRSTSSGSVSSHSVQTKKSTSSVTSAQSSNQPEKTGAANEMAADAAGAFCMVMGAVLALL